jgi:hypothetical protein
MYNKVTYNVSTLTCTSPNTMRSLLCAWNTLHLIQSLVIAAFKWLLRLSLSAVTPWAGKAH